MSLILEHGEALGRPPRPRRRKGLWLCAPGFWIAGWVLSAIGGCFLMTLIVIQQVNRPGHPFPDVILDARHGVAEGRVAAINRKTTSRHEGGDLYRVDFSFPLPDGKVVTGYAYTKMPLWQVGHSVAIQYDPENPQLARVEGTAAAIYPFWLLILPMAFLIVGSVLLLPARRRIKVLRCILTEGAWTEGHILRLARHQSIKVNNVRPWIIGYAFNVPGRGAVQGESLLLPSRGGGDVQPCTVGQPCVVLYLVNDPDCHTLALKDDQPDALARA